MRTAELARMDAHSNYGTDEDEAPTLMVDRASVAKLLAPAPPPLPFPLARPKRRDAWLDALPPQARQVLEQARRGHLPWPRTARLPGAVAVPLQRIPSLRAR